jgi:hypothetical protein
MSRPKGAAQFEGDLDHAYKAFLRHATEETRTEILRHASLTLHRMSRECVRQLQAEEVEA